MTYRTQEERLKAVEELIPLYESHAESSRYHGKVYRNVASDLRSALSRFSGSSNAAAPVTVGTSWDSVFIRPVHAIEEDHCLQFTLPMVDCPHEETQLRRKEIHKKYANPVRKHVEVCLLCGQVVREW